MGLPLLTEAEQVVMDKLGDAWDEFLKLPSIHSQDNMEFMHAIHCAQNIVLARPVLRAKAKEMTGKEFP